STLHAIAAKRISMFDPAHEHVGSCSPCFKELTDIRRARQRRKILLWAMGTTGTAIVVFAVWLTYFRFQRLENPAPAQTQSVQHSEALPPVQNSGGSQATTPSPSVSPPEVKYEAALLDLRNASATRTVEPANPDPSYKSLEIPRGLLALTVQLPIG